MIDKHELPLLNPVLKFQKSPDPMSSKGGGKSQNKIVKHRLEKQQNLLKERGESLYSSRADYPNFGRKTHLVVHMFSDSFAPSYTPNDLFNSSNGCEIVAPVREGYLVEADLSCFQQLVAEIENPHSYALQVDISRISNFMAFTDDSRLQQWCIDELWQSAPNIDGSRLFIIWLTPFRDSDAREALISTVNELSQNRFMLPVSSDVGLPVYKEDTTVETSWVSLPSESSIVRLTRIYRNRGIGCATVRVSDKSYLAKIISSGISFRIDPVRPIWVMSSDEAQHPQPPIRNENAPVVAVIDSGLNSTSYQPAEAWRMRSLVPDNQADYQHGNRVSSLVIHAHAWNENRNLPSLECRVGTVQAIPNRYSNHSITEDELLNYLRNVANEFPNTRVWNISANQVGPNLNYELVSYLGHNLAEIAREHGILPIISVGNIDDYVIHRPNPPADCEAAVVVGGREADVYGNPAQPCAFCRRGPGPNGMLKPDLSWFSTLKMYGGITDTGSSYATPLVSSLVAHTFNALSEPTPDLVKALLINRAELDEHSPALGWGTPYRGHMPWDCAPGSVTLAWRAKLIPGNAYYWNDIPIPPELVRDGKLFGKARLTAILKPIVSPYQGSNYFASRLETALQYHANPKAGWKPLLDPMKESTINNDNANNQTLKKWSPIRCHSADFSKSGGRKFTKNNFRLYARVFTRDLFQFGWNHHSEAGPQEVTFVLTLWSGEKRRSIYDSTVQALGNLVESAVVEQQIEQEIRS